MDDEKQWMLVNDRYGDEVLCTPQQLVEMCESLGWQRPELQANSDASEYRDQTGEVVLRLVEVNEIPFDCD